MDCRIESSSATAEDMMNRPLSPTEVGDSGDLARDVVARLRARCEDLKVMASEFEPVYALATRLDLTETSYRLQV